MFIVKCVELSWIKFHSAYKFLKCIVRTVHSERHNKNWLFLWCYDTFELNKAICYTFLMGLWRQSLCCAVCTFWYMMASVVLTNKLKNMVSFTHCVSFQLKSRGPLLYEKLYLYVFEKMAEEMVSIEFGKHWVLSKRRSHFHLNTYLWFYILIEIKIFTSLGYVLRNTFSFSTYDSFTFTKIVYCIHNWISVYNSCTRIGLQTIPVGRVYVNASNKQLFERFIYFVYEQ